MYTSRKAFRGNATRQALNLRFKAKHRPCRTVGWRRVAAEGHRALVQGLFRLGVLLPVERLLKAKLHRGRFENVSPLRARIMSAVRGRRNRTTELTLRMLLVRDGVRGWILHADSVPGHPDFYFTRRRLAVFVDGCFWHGCPMCGHVPKTRAPFWRAKIQRNSERDREITNRLRRAGIRVLRIWEHELRRRPQAVVVRVTAALRRAQTRVDESRQTTARSADKVMFVSRSNQRAIR